MAYVRTKRVAGNLKKLSRAYFSSDRLRVASLNFKKALAIVTALALALTLALLATARGEDEPVNALIHVEVRVHHTYALVTYNIMLRGPATLRQINVSLPSWGNLYASVCEGDYSKSWVKSIRLEPGETYNITIESLWLISVEGDKHVLRVPSNPLVPSLSADRIEVVIFPPPHVSDIGVSNLNFTRTDDLLKLDVCDVSLEETRTITIDITFNATTASPWLFKVKRLVRDVDPLSGTIVDYVTVESLSPTTGWQIGLSARQSVFCFKPPLEAKILEVGDLAGSFAMAQSERALDLGSYAISSTDDSAILYVRPRTSLALGERTTIYIKYSTLEAKSLQALPQYIDYADEVELRFRAPPGSEVLKASPEPNRKDSTIYYKFYKLSRIQNPTIIVDISPPLAPSTTIMVASIAGVVAIALGALIGKQVMTKKRARLEVDLRPFKDLFDNYASIAQRVWRIHEDYLKGRVKDSTYRKRIQELRPAYLEALKKLMEASKKFEKHPKLGKVARGISEHVSKASRVEESASSIEAMRRDKKVAVAELSRKAEELAKQIEELRKELRDLSLKMSKAIA